MKLPTKLLSRLRNSYKSRSMDRAIIMARGLGKRMQRPSSSSLTAQQEAAASRGIKALIPVGRPFLDYVLSTLADAGYRKVCLVIGPEHSAVREYYSGTYSRLAIDFAVQIEPLGTADAVLAAQSVVADEDFVVLNSDNYYPREALASLRLAPGPALASFDYEVMRTSAGLTPQRIAAFSIVLEEKGILAGIIEKPAPETLASFTQPFGVNMNCWRFDRRIFDACRAISPSPRGELELPDAVQYSINRIGVRYEVRRFSLPVADLSSRDDIEPVRRMLESLEVRL